MAANAKPIRVSVVGTSDDAGALRVALARLGELEVIAKTAPADQADVILVEATGSTPPAGEVAALRAHTIAPVILLAESPSKALVDWALDGGAVDVLAAPHAPEAVLFAIEKAVRAERRAVAGERRPSRIVTVFSPKGGTGKSVISTNLAAALARFSVDTLLVDLDLQFGDAAIMLGVSPKNTLRELLDTDEIDAERLSVYTETHSSGLHILPAPMRPEEAELIDEDAIRKVLGLARGSHEAVVVDTSPFFHGSTLATLDVTDELLLVCSPDIPTVKNVRLALRTLEQLAFTPDKVRVVLNRYSDRVGMRKREVEDVLERKIDFVLPLDPTVPDAVNRGEPAVFLERTPFATSLLALASDLFPELSAPAEPQAKRSPRLLAWAWS